MRKSPAVIAFGGNIGDPDSLFQQARKLLAEGNFRERAFSSVITTEPENCVPGTPPFRNAVLLGEWEGSAAELLHLCQRIERTLGRPAQHSSRESRTVDLDLILLGDVVANTPELILPHPRAHLRDFVLKPLREIAPELEEKLFELTNRRKLLA